MEKKRYEIVVAGCQLAIITDEREEFVNSVVETIDREIREITAATKRSSNLDAAILCAIQYYSEKVKAEKRARNLEAQISLYDANMRRFREENIALREKVESLGGTVETASPSEEAPEAKASAPEKSAKSAKAEAKKPAARTEKAKNDAPAEKADDAALKQVPLDGAERDDARAARIRAIDELLGRGKK
ncbi:MAG: cell division protein ZapA [Clostridia bacterium]|nr:cell division protein ZapA [Clostridia bacterium]